MAQTRPTNEQTFILVGSRNRVVKVSCYTKSGARGFTHFAETEGKKTYICYINRTWESFCYESVLREIVERIARGKKDKECLLNSIKTISKKHAEEAEKWLEGIKKDYDGLSDETKKHLANACPEITSQEQAESVMKISKVFDAIFRMCDDKPSNEGGKQ